MIFLYIILIIIVLLVVNSLKKPATSNISAINKREIKPYEKTSLKIGLSGVQYRLDAKDGLKINSELLIKFDINNEHDKNALAVFRKDTNVLIGYLPRNQWKLIKTLKSNPNYLAVLRDKKWTYGGGSIHGNIWGTVEIYLGYSSDELIEIRKQNNLQ